MNKLIFAFAVLILSSLSAAAQTNDDYRKFEVFAGYSYGHAGVDYGVAGTAATVYHDQTNFHGFNGAAVFNVSRYVGIKGDVSGTYNRSRQTFSVPSGIVGTPFVNISFDTDNSLYNFLGGVQIKDNASEEKLKPFGHALAGVAYRTNHIPGGGLVCVAIIPCPSSTTETGFAGAFGGGLDVRINKRFDFRVVQVDYNPIKFDRGVDHNFRLGIGIVFK